jgi:hypothetical protein
VSGQLELKNLVVVVAPNLERFSLFRENRQFRFLGTGSKTPPPHSFKKNISHFENHLSFQNLKKIWLGDFQG